MELKEIMTKEEQLAAKKLVAAYLGEQVARANLAEAKAELKAAAKVVTQLSNRTDGKDEYGTPVFVGTIPQKFVIYFNDVPYLVEIDEEGGEGHQVSSIGGILK